MNKSSFFAFTLFALSSVSLAAENTQLDRIENKVDKVVDAVVIADPLKNKTFGIEVNPIRLLLFNGEQKSFSGTVSLFNVFDNAELAFPVFIGKSKADIFSHRGELCLRSFGSARQPWRNKSRHDEKRYRLSIFL